MKLSFQDIKTERLLLRQPNLNDADCLFETRFHDEVIKYIDRKKPENKESINQFILDRQNDIKEGKLLFWVIQKINNEDVIGTICLWNFNDDKTIAEVGYELHPNYHHKGIMSEALKAVLEFGFKTLNIKIIEAFTDKDNLSSIKLLNKFNFKRDAHRKDKGFPNNRIYIKRND